MRRFVAALASLAVAAVGLTAATTGMASAACPEDSAWGTGGLTPAQTYAIGVELHYAAGYTPVVLYLDDRDIVGTSARGDNPGAGGLWLFLESGAKRGLQRGGETQFALAAAGLGDPAGFSDPCKQSKAKNRDYILF